MLKLSFITLILINTLSASVIPHPNEYEVKENSNKLKLVTSLKQNPIVLQKLKSLESIELSDSKKTTFKILIQHPINTVQFRMDESYEISSSEDSVVLKSETEFGALHGLETLRQLLADFEGKLPEVHIKDHPRFPWRGLLIDVARSKLSLETLKIQITQMAALKFNVLHLHLSDDQSFRLESKNFPKLHSQNPDKFFYTQKEMKDLIQFAAQNGIRVIPEFDVPGHVSAMVAAYPGLASKNELKAPSKNFGPQDASLDPTKEETYVFLEKLFKEMTELFPDPYFHIGGDEVTGKHWLGNPLIVQYMKDHQLSTIVDLQFVFTKRMETIVKKLGKKMIGWDEILKEGGELDAVTQIWRAPKYATEAISRKSAVIFSYGYYLDLQLSSGTHYMMDPTEAMGLTQDPTLLWGGEACLWSERVTDKTINNRIWPRAMAVAERLWSSPDKKDVRDFYDRQIGLGRTFKIYELGILEKIFNETHKTAIDQNLLGEFFSWMEPGKFYSQHRYRKWNFETVQNNWVDVLPSESLKTVMMGWVFDDWTKKHKPADLKLLEDTISSWAKLSESLLIINDSRLSEKEDLAALAKDLAGLSRVATDALLYLKSEDKPPKLWFMENRTRLGMMGQIRAGMQPAMYTLVEEMVYKVALKNNLPAR